MTVSGLPRVYAFVLLSLLVACVSNAPASAQVSSDPPTLITIQSFDPPVSTRSITFLSSGYQDKEIFLRDVRTCVGGLYNVSAGIVSDPWPRYAMLLNVYAVYQYSVDAGASRIVERVHDCSYMHDCKARNVNNNLGCAFGSPNPHLIFCNINSVLELATYGPEQDIAVVIVNDAEPSGTASNGVAYITNDPDFMVFLFIHYLNRAIAELHEEYSLGFAEHDAAADFGGPNCGLPNSEKVKQWSYWDDKPFAGGSPITGFLGHGCSFSNFVAPTTNDCLMRNSTVSAMCPVCRETLNSALFDNGVANSLLRSPSTARINLASGRCPPQNRAVCVIPGSGEDLILSVGPFAEQDDVFVRWYAADGSTLATDVAQLRVEDYSSWTFPTVIRASVHDNTPYVRPDWRGEVYTVTMSFSVNECRESTTCEEDPPACFESLEPGYTPCTTSIGSAAVDSLKKAEGADVRNNNGARIGDPTNRSEITWPVDDSPHSPQYNKGQVAAIASVVSCVAVIAFVVIMVVYYKCVKPRPREVLNVRPFDSFIYNVLCCLCVVAIVITSLMLIFSVVYIPIEFIFGLQIFIASIVIGVVAYTASIANLCSALFRWFAWCVVCAAVLFICSMGFFAIGTFALWAHLNSDSVAFSNSLGRLWVNTIEKGRSGYICTIQQELSCSGYNAGCFMTNSSECPSACESNIFVNACQVRFLEFVSRNYMPIGVMAIICGFIFVLIPMLNMLYCLRFRQISRTGRLRRSFRSDPHAPVVPITYREAEVVREMVKRVCDKPGMTLQGRDAVSFLEKVFGERLTKEYARLISGRGPLTCDELMTIHFPYVTSSSIDPRMLTPDESEGTGDMIQLQKKQYAKLEAFMEAAGALSPEALHRLFQTYTRKRFLPNKDDILASISEAAAKCEDAPYCRGLNSRELEGLRGAWVALNPRIVGCLNDEKIDTFYQWSHGKPLPNREAFQQWKKSLDVTKSGCGIGWREFCYPYAQRALLQRSRDLLATQEKEVPPEFVSSEAITAKYGKEVMERCLLPCEQEVPIERLIAFLLNERQEADAAAFAAQRRGGESKEKRWVEGAILSLIQTIGENSKR